MNQAEIIKANELYQSRFLGALYKAIGKKYNKSQPGWCEHASGWADAVVCVSARAITIKVYVNFKSPKLTEAERANLIRLATQGITTYWSRSVSVENTLFDVTVRAEHKTDSPLPAILKIEKGGGYKRSFNPCVLGVNARFIYNQGCYSDLNFIEGNFKLISAHEFGHYVLHAAGGLGLSWGHKGSTGIISQSVKKSTPGYPTSGPIDLMKYYDDKKQKVTFSQLMSESIASEEDVMRLIWLSARVWNE